jgi:hypothetical protein
VYYDGKHLQAFEEWGGSNRRLVNYLLPTQIILVHGMVSTFRPGIS